MFASNNTNNTNLIMSYDQLIDYVDTVRYQYNTTSTSTHTFTTIYDSNYHKYIGYNNNISILDEFYLNYNPVISFEDSEKGLKRYADSNNFVEEFSVILNKLDKSGLFETEEQYQYFYDNLFSIVLDMLFDEALNSKIFKNILNYDEKSIIEIVDNIVRYYLIVNVEEKLQND